MKNKNYLFVIPKRASFSLEEKDASFIFCSARHELAVNEGHLIRQARVIISTSPRPSILDQLHAAQRDSELLSFAIIGTALSGQAPTAKS